MRQQLLDLHEIQKIDLAIRELEKAKEELPAQLDELQRKVTEAQDEITTLAQERDTLAVEIRTHEESVRNENDKARKWERRLTDIRNQREYQALSREVEGAKRAVRDHEEQIIELMTRKEELDGKLEALEDDLAENAVDREAEREKVEGELAQVDQKMETETNRRDALLPNVKAPLLRRYDQVRKKRLGVGLVPADGGSCTGCNMRLPPQLYNILMRVDSIETCPSCQRILIFQGALEAPTGTSAEGDSSAPVEATP